MKLKTKIFSIPLVGILILASCSKDTLNLNPNNAVALSSAIKTESDLLVALVGAYSSIRNTNLYGRTLPVKGDLMADNTYVTTSNSGRYITMNNYAFNNGDGDAGGVWSSAYVAINNANTVINSGLTGTANINQYIGEALAIRALMHFELVRNFALPFTVNSSSPGIPYVTTYNSGALPSRPTVASDYTQIIADLEKAYSLLTVYRGTGYFSKYAARALEARVYQSMGDWANAKLTALDVVTNSGFTLLPSATYANFWKATAPQTTTKNETLFEVVSDAINNNGFDQLGYIYIQVNGSGYADLFATPGVVSLYSATDVRNNFFSAGTRAGQVGTAYSCQKYTNPANSAGRDNTKVLRYADVLLILAEAYYNTGDMVNANLYLNMVATQRDPSFAGWNDTGALVLEDILTERQKEFLFEGYRFWDLVRLKRSFTKIKNPNPLATVSVAPGNIALVFPIPVTELNANPNMTQNAGY